MVFIFVFFLPFLISAEQHWEDSNIQGSRMFDLMFKAQMLVAHFHPENFHHEHFSMLDTTAADHYVEHAVCSPGCP